jgi:hypothetical protein
MKIITLNPLEQATALQITNIKTAALHTAKALMGFTEYPLPLSTSAEVQQSPEQHVGIVIGNELAALLSYMTDDPSRLCSITALIVLPEKNRMRIAANLLDYLGTTHPDFHFTISTLSPRMKAMMLFTRLGFQETARTAPDAAGMQILSFRLEQYISLKVREQWARDAHADALRNVPAGELLTVIGKNLWEVAVGVRYRRIKAYFIKWIGPRVYAGEHYRTTADCEAFLTIYLKPHFDDWHKIKIKAGFSFEVIHAEEEAAGFICNPLELADFEQTYLPTEASTDMYAGCRVTLLKKSIWKRQLLRVNKPDSADE